uniref:Wall-associated receptor kinase galacturonan-binding domain-containing protein n=1 Tax=Oryza punctata TaxID=4537 RepID=A0A0E0K6L9_ORYPU
MTTSTLHLQVLALTIFLVCAAAVTPASAQPWPGCPDKCGDISIPYPFGVGTGCARDPYFELECNRTYSPPRLIVFTHRQHLLNLSLADGEAIALINARRQCYNSTEGLVNETSVDRAVTLVGSTAYRFSAERNRFVALGCPNMGYFVDTDGYYVSGCTSFCRPSSQKLVASSTGCTGEGCCQSRIPTDTIYYAQYIQTFKPGEGDPILRGGTTACRYVFLADAEWFNSGYRGDFNRSDDFAVPVVLDWAIRNVGNCEIAVLNRTDYACRSANSECIDSTNGQGYRCRCSMGYEGNPYLDGGCKGATPKHTYH